MTELKSKRTQFIKEFDHLMRKCNLGASALDCQAIQFINEFNSLLNAVIKEGEIK